MAVDSAIQSQVQTSYDKIAKEYTEWVESHPSPRLRYVDKMFSLLASHSSGTSRDSRILELGCGAGVPVTAYLADKVGSIVANDISEAQLEIARKRLDASSPARVEFIAGDMSKLSLEAEHFDGVIAFFSLFHLPIPEQVQMLKKIFGWLKSGGVLVCNFGAAPDQPSSTEAETEKHQDDRMHWNESFFGSPMYWANLGTHGSVEMVRDAGFEITEWDVLDATDGKGELEDGEPDAGVKFVWVVARKPEA